MLLRVKLQLCILCDSELICIWPFICWTVTDILQPCAVALSPMAAAADERAGGEGERETNCESKVEECGVFSNRRRTSRSVAPKKPELIQGNGG